MSNASLAATKTHSMLMGSVLDFLGGGGGCGGLPAERGGKKDEPGAAKALGGEKRERVGRGESIAGGASSERCNGAGESSPAQGEDQGGEHGSKGGARMQSNGVAETNREGGATEASLRNVSSSLKRKMEEFEKDGVAGSLALLGLDRKRRRKPREEVAVKEERNGRTNGYAPGASDKEEGE